MVDYRLSKLEAIQKPTQMVFVCDLPAIIKGGPISRRTVRVAPKLTPPCSQAPRKGFAMLLQRDIIVIAISALVGIALAYVVHGLP
jgi:hypothetical protein